MTVIYIHITFYPKVEEYTVFSSAHGIFSRIDHMLGHKTIFNRFKKIEIISSINSMKLDITYKKNGKIINMWRLKNMILNNQWVNEKIKGEIKKCL